MCWAFAEHLLCPHPDDAPLAGVWLLTCLTELLYCLLLNNKGTLTFIEYDLFCSQNHSQHPPAQSMQPDRRLHRFTALFVIRL